MEKRNSFNLEQLLNQSSINLLSLPRKTKTPEGFVLGTSGKGMGFRCKSELLHSLQTIDEKNVIVTDPKNEWN